MSANAIPEIQRQNAILSRENVERSIAGYREKFRLREAGAIHMSDKSYEETAARLADAEATLATLNARIGDR